MEHCILLGEKAGEYLIDESYYFELRLGDCCVSKQMTVQEYEWLTEFLGRCDNNLADFGYKTVNDCISNQQLNKQET